MNDKPICAECKYYVNFSTYCPPPRSRCQKYIDLIKGKPMPCEYVRSHFCGFEGKDFEPAKSNLQKTRNKKSLMRCIKKFFTSIKQKEQTND